MGYSAAVLQNIEHLDSVVPFIDKRYKKLEKLRLTLVSQPGSATSAAYRALLNLCYFRKPPRGSSSR